MALTEMVSTHSRLKAAGTIRQAEDLINHGFNTQPPEGGWEMSVAKFTRDYVFQHTAA